EGHPQASNIGADLQNLQRKVQAGADSVITQYFYNADAYFYFVDQCRQLGIDVPIIPGIMPITRLKNLQRFSTMCGAEIPLWILKKLML
ncbi:methylenetetrahydrofolate reductase, partial [Acinetobacter baumannii]